MQTERKSKQRKASTKVILEREREREIERERQGFPWWHNSKESACNAEDPWVRKIPWRGKRQLTPVFLPGKFHG